MVDSIKLVEKEQFESGFIEEVQERFENDMKFVKFLKKFKFFFLLTLPIIDLLQAERAFLVMRSISAKQVATLS